MSLPTAAGWSVLEAVRASQDPEHFFATRSPDGGDLFCVELPGAGPLYLSGHPDAAAELFKAPPDTFAPPRPNPVEPLLGPGSLILLSGRRHHRERKILAPPFHGRRMKAYAGLMAQLAVQAVSDLEPGDVLDARELAQSLTLLVIIRAIFGVEDPERVTAVREAIETATSRYSGLLALVPASRIRLFGLSPWDRFRSAVDALDEVLREEISRRKAAPDPGEDILSLLLGLRYEDGEPMSDDALLDELRTLLVAGHETAATSLAWALGYVHQDERIEARLRAELPGGGEYLEAVVKESLRRHPAVPIVLRTLVKPWSFRGHDLPEGTTVGLALTLLHTRPDTWEKPQDFYPEHFLDRSYTPFEYAPFGGGARRCAGAAFASFEMKVLLATLLQHGLFEAAGPLPRPVTRSITMSPGGPLPLRFTGPAAPPSPR